MSWRVFIVLFVCAAVSLPGEPSVRVSGHGSERATVGNGNKIVHYQGKTHVVWQDVTREGYVNQVKSYDHSTGKWSEPFALGHGIDNHARPIIVVDFSGFLHFVLSGHNSPVTWRRSARPNDSSEWTAPKIVGEGTYPVILCGRDNTLYLTMRGNNRVGVHFYSKPENGEWRLTSHIVKQAEKYRNAYGAFHMGMALAPDGDIHAVIDFYEGQDEVGRGLHQAVCYLKSADGGKTWRKADGSLAKTPARPEDMDVFARSIRTRMERLPRPELRNFGIQVDAEGRPYVFYLSHSERPGRLLMVTLDSASHWTEKNLSPILESKWPDMRVTDGRTTIQEDDRLCILLTLSPFNDEWIQGRPSRAMSMKERTDERVALLSSADRGKTFDVESILSPGIAFNAPNLIQAVGANELKEGSVPIFLHFDGSRAYPGGGDYYQKPVIEYLKAGEFWTNNVFLYGLGR